MIPIVCFVGPSGVGKTTLLEQIVMKLKSRGFRVAVIKHAHHGFEIDQQGKDSWRMTQAGCDLVVVSSRSKMALIQQRMDEASLDEIAPLLEGHADIIMAEGYKDSDKAKIEVFRSAVCKNISTEPERLLAIVTDQRIPLGVRQFDFAEIDSIVDFIIGHVLPAGLDNGGGLQPSQSAIS